MNEVCYVAYRAEFQQKAQRIFNENEAHADTMVYSPETLAALPHHKYRVLIGRGKTAWNLREQLKIPVVEIPIFFEDIMQALLKASDMGYRIGIIGYGNFLNGLDMINPILNVEITQVVAESPVDTRQKIEQLQRLGIDVIVGGLLQTQIAQELGLRHVLLDMNERALMTAYREAESICKSLLHELRQKEEIDAILNSTQEGYIAIDQEETVTLVNATAAHLMGLNRSDTVGRPLRDVLPELVGLTTVLRSGEEQLRNTMHVRTGDVLCDMLPFRIENGKSVGAIAAFHDINTVTKGEHAIRNKLYGSGLYATYTFDSVVHTSTAMDELIRTAKKYAVRESTVLIVGETGVGKEMFAQSIHNASNRRKGPFVAVNCASIPESILESELFGYEEGAFTGAKKSGKPGLFELAHKGTLFLDEIGEMPIGLQAHLLRALQERKVMRLGGSQLIPVDVRIISATNEQLYDLIAEKRFRADLFYRLNVLTLVIPPLRDRLEDVPALVQTYLKSREIQLKLQGGAVDEMMHYSWPGNVRQLDNFIERLAVISDRKAADAHLVRTLLNCYEPPTPHMVPTSTGQTLTPESIRDVLKRYNGSRRQAAAFLGIHRSTLWRLMQKYEL